MPRKKATMVEQEQNFTKTRKTTRRSNGEGSIIERKDGRFEVQITLPNKQRKSVYGKTRKEAQAKARELRQQVDQGSYVESSRETVADYLREWLVQEKLACTIGKLKASSYVSRRSLMENHVIPALGSITFQKLTREQVQAFFLSLQEEKQLASLTIHKIYVILRFSLKKAVKSQKISRNPTDDILLPKKEKKEMRYLTSEEIEHIVQSAWQHRHGCLFLVGAMTGMRRNELLALKWDDVDAQKSELRVRHNLSYYNVDGTGYTYQEDTPKSQKSRRIILVPKFVITALQRHRMQQEELRQRTPKWEEHNLVFPNQQGRYQSTSAVQVAYKRFLEKEGLTDAHLHAIRHGHATDLLEKGVNPRVVQERLGHSNVATTLQLYVHVTPKMQREAVMKLNDQYGMGEGK